MTHPTLPASKAEQFHWRRVGSELLELAQKSRHKMRAPQVDRKFYKHFIVRNASLLDTGEGDMA